MKTPNTESEVRIAIEALVEASTGVHHAVTTEKRRGYWHAACGNFANSKGEREEASALRTLFNDVEMEAGRGLFMALRSYGDAVAAGGYVAALEKQIASARMRAAGHEAEVAAALAKVDDRKRAVFAVLTAK